MDEQKLLARIKDLEERVDTLQGIAAVSDGLLVVLAASQPDLKLLRQGLKMHLEATKVHYLNETYSEAARATIEEFGKRYLAVLARVQHH